MEMSKQWTDTFCGEIESFQETISAFDRGELDRKAYKGISGGLGSYAQRDASKHMLRLRLPAGRLTLDRLKFLAEVAEREGYQKPQQLWLPVLPAQLVMDQLAGYTDVLFDGENWPQYPEKWDVKTQIGLCDHPTHSPRSLWCLTLRRTATMRSAAFP